MADFTIISIIAAALLAILLWERQAQKRRIAEELKRQEEVNRELMKRIPVMSGGGSDREPLTVEQIADAIRIEGFIPETEENLVIFRVQGKTYYVDGNRLPLVFVVKPFDIDPDELEMDLFREAAHRMSDRLVMVKATVSDDGKRWKDVAALASRTCMRQYGLTSLADSVQDQDNNYTRFICISKELEIYPGADRTSLMAVLPHEAGSLYKMLSRFYALGINLNKLESRPLPNRDFEFMFYFDLDTPVYSPRFLQLMDELETITERFTYLGSYSEVI